MPLNIKRIFWLLIGGLVRGEKLVRGEELNGYVREDNSEYESTWGHGYGLKNDMWDMIQCHDLVIANTCFKMKWTFAIF